MGVPLMPIVKEAFQKVILRGGKLFCYIHVINTYLCTVTYSIGPSMLPTVNVTGDFMLAERVSTRFGKAGPGDVVLLRSSEDPTRYIVKRIIAKEGQTVTHQDNTLIVPKGHVWIEGDNKENSRDSRVFGPVPYGLLQARPFWKILLNDSLKLYMPLPRRGKKVLFWYTLRYGLLKNLDHLISLTNDTWSHIPCITIFT